MKTFLRLLLQPPITRQFRHKLHHNFHTLTPGEMVLYWLFIRPFWNKQQRFFFEGTLGLWGQMYRAERQALYETIIRERPRQCFEIGTFTGGGSTFFLSKAFTEIGTGTLVTMENNEHYFTKGKNYYEQKLPEQAAHIKFVFASTPSAFDQFILADKNVDAVFFDGAEDGAETLLQYRYFEPYFTTGSIIMFHDWNTAKTAAIKPVILGDHHWEQLVLLTPPYSVGFAVFKRRP
jgi:hypothetical protein